MRWCLTGGGSPYAVNLACLLRSQGHEVMGISRSPLKEPFNLAPGYEFHVHTIGPETDAIIDLLKAEKPDFIVNYAAQGEGAVSFNLENWKYFYRTNVEYLVNFTERLHGAPWLQKFIQIGSSEPYGSVDKPVDETAPDNPTSPYGVSKMAADKHILSISRACGFPGLVLRSSNSYCRGQQLHRIIPKTFIHGRKGKRIPLHGGGRARKSYLHADDLSRAVILLAEKGKIGEVYNCGPIDPISIRDLLVSCADTLGMGFEELVDEAPDRTGQDGCYWLNSQKLRSLGWSDLVSLEAGLYSTLGWVKAYWDEIKSMPTEYELRP